MFQASLLFLLLVDVVCQFNLLLLLLLFLLLVGVVFQVNLLLLLLLFLLLLFSSCAQESSGGDALTRTRGEAEEQVLLKCSTTLSSLRLLLWDTESAKCSMTLASLRLLLWVSESAKCSMTLASLSIIMGCRVC
jgi:hypothetical protein